GSTGRPKGVMMEHRNVANMLMWGLGDTISDFDSVLQFAAISFDISIQETFSAFLTGGQLSLIRHSTRTDIPRLLNLIAARQVKTIFLPPSILNVMFSHEEYIRLFPSCVKYIIAAGDLLVVNPRLQDYLKTNRVYLYNQYGPTEAHVITSLTLPPDDDIPMLPCIGKPVPNMSIYILDPYYNIQPLGVSG
ncbi:MAG: AMP-binding protein, partial [bacterium]|nr:AMP-binding protein [bacterium]